jgi:hypothetical protein
LAFDTQLRLLIQALIFLHRKRPAKTDKFYHILASTLTIFDTDIAHPRFHVFAEESARMMHTSTPLSLYPAYRFCEFLLAEFILTVLRLGRLEEAFGSVDTVTTAAWKLVWFILSQQRSLQSYANPSHWAMAKFGGFLGSCVLPPGKGRCASIVLNVVKNANFPIVTEPILDFLRFDQKTDEVEKPRFLGSDDDQIGWDAMLVSFLGDN